MKVTGIALAQVLKTSSERRVGLDELLGLRLITGGEWHALVQQTVSTGAPCYSRAVRPNIFI